MGMTITDEQIQALRNAFDANPANKVAQNAVTSVQLPSLALNRSIIQDTANTFSTLSCRGNEENECQEF